ncbi:hypothetical protein [Pseudomonas chlororaphis]|uniref:Uncharacterized protein n=1 Tax=Pseudomonas chlororaphis subsp. aurantiaca TaxID=86192 RepID=A0AAJ1E6Y1_9PSED|nr:hypothetical protein [Pseudomonas chlororaphis]MBU4631911.1 hypothetical protein [Pseudomonas chlororaphis subsp. aurantiaca]
MKLLHVDASSKGEGANSRTRVKLESLARQGRRLCRLSRASLAPTEEDLLFLSEWPVGAKT